MVFKLEKQCGYLTTQISTLQYLIHYYYSNGHFVLQIFSFHSFSRLLEQYKLI